MVGQEREGWPLHRSRVLTSVRVNNLHLPIASEPMAIGPTLTRPGSATLAPRPSPTLRTCRLRPSVKVTSKWVYLAESRTRATEARRVGHPTARCRREAAEAA